MSGVLVSVVITTKNEGRNIEACIKSIQEQTYKNIEVIVVDNFSTDTTVEIAKKYTDKVYQKGPERSAQRNYGMIDVAGGEYVMYIDADMVLSPSLISECVGLCEQNQENVAIHIPEIVLGKGYWSRVRRFERMFYDGTVIDGARFFRKAVFQSVGGFDEGFSGPEDWDLDKKIKQKGEIALLDAPERTALRGFVWDFIRERGIRKFHPLCCVYHNEAVFNLGKYLSKKGYYATSFDSYIQKWGENDPDLKKQFGLWYRYFGVFLENGKWKRLIAHPFLAFGVYFLRFLVGVVFLSRKFQK